MLREINAATELLKVRIESSRYKSINQFLELSTSLR